MQGTSNLRTSRQKHITRVSDSFSCVSVSVFLDVCFFCHHVSIMTGWPLVTETDAHDHSRPETARADEVFSLQFIWMKS